MSIETIKKDILKELDDVPEDHLAEVQKLIHSYAVLLKKNRTRYVIHPEVAKMRGLLPNDIDAKDEYYEYLRKKHV